MTSPLTPLAPAVTCRDVVSSGDPTTGLSWTAWYGQQLREPLGNGGAGGGVPEMV